MREPTPSLRARSSDEPTGFHCCIDSEPRPRSPLIRGSVETRFSEKYPPSVYTVFLNNTVTRVGYFSRYFRKDGRDVALRTAGSFDDDSVTHRQSGPGKMSKYFMISSLAKSALHPISRAFGLTRLA